MRRLLQLYENLSPVSVTEPDQLDGYAKIEFPILYRGVEGGTDAARAIRHSGGGDMGDGVYLTAHAPTAATYGGGPRASISAGTRVVHAYTIVKVLYPEDVVFMFGGRLIGSTVTLVSGNGITLWSGPWKSKQIEAALAEHDAKIVVGTEHSIGRNQVCVRDFSLLRPVPAAPSTNTVTAKRAGRSIASR